MKRIQFILPVLFTMALGFVILSCDNKEVVTGGVQVQKKDITIWTLSLAKNGVQLQLMPLILK